MKASAAESAQGKPRSRIVVCDDEPLVCGLVSRWLRNEGYRCSVAHSADQALGFLASEPYELLISDIMMPGKSGIELLEITRKKFPDVAIIMATGLDDRATAIRTLELGAYGYVIKPFDKNEFIINVVNALERRRLTLESREYENRLEQEVRDRTLDIRLREEEIALRLISATAYRDEETGAHIRRLGLYSAALAEKLGWDGGAVADIRIAAPMHDVGKIGIPDSILLKPGKLTADEFEVIKRHTTIGGGLLGGSEIPLLQMAADVALSHHEKWDGSGYPQGLAGESIPQAARIVAVADVYDALVHDRVYRRALPEEKAVAIMSEEADSHFDPRIFKCFLGLLPVFRQIRERIRDEKTAQFQRYKAEVM